MQVSSVDAGQAACPAVLLDEAAIDYEAPVSQQDLQMLVNHGWEISEGERYARLYSEEWSNIQAAVFSTKWWIEQCQ